MLYRFLDQLFWFNEIIAIRSSHNLTMLIILPTEIHLKLVNRTFCKLTLSSHSFILLYSFFPPSKFLPLIHHSSPFIATHNSACSSSISFLYSSSAFIFPLHQSSAYVSTSSHLHLLVNEFPLFFTLCLNHQRLVPPFFPGALTGSWGGSLRNGDSETFFPKVLSTNCP